MLAESIYADKQQHHEEKSQSGDDEDDHWGSIPGEVYSILHQLADKWADVPDVKNMTLKPLKGAMTNHVYECRWPYQDKQPPCDEGSDSKKVLVRVYGDGCDIFFRREDEVSTFERMSQLGQGPRLLARFQNGRIEEFLHARTLTAADLRDEVISTRIAEKLNEFHELDIQRSREPELWSRLRFWIEKALELCPPSCKEEFKLGTLKEEVSNLENKISKPGERIGFCHNDLQYGNIMIDKVTGSVTIIDYEYASYNPVAFDIANHFCEMTANYHSETPHALDFSKYPDINERSRFIEEYLQASSSKTWSHSPTAPELLEHVEGYTLASHLHWGLWGILSATFSDIDFNYLEYARHRFNLYYSNVKQLC